MAMSINKIANEIVGGLKKTNLSGSNKSIWAVLKSQVTEEGSWDEDLIDTVKEQIDKWVDSKKKDQIIDLWEQTEAAAEKNFDSDKTDYSEIKEDFSEEMLSVIMDKLDDNIYPESYTKPGYHAGDVEDDEFSKVDIDDEDNFDFDDDEFDDFDDDEFFDEDADPFR